MDRSGRVLKYRTKTGDFNDEAGKCKLIQVVQRVSVRQIISGLAGHHTHHQRLLEPAYRRLIQGQPRGKFPQVGVLLRG